MAYLELKLANFSFCAFFHNGIHKNKSAFASADTYPPCSPYLRSMDTISDTAGYFNKEIITDERLRERVKGSGGSNGSEMYRKRRENLDFHEENGESIGMVQKRNIEALLIYQIRKRGRIS